nr:unnamed protein product [Callosobruchus analis]
MTSNVEDVILAAAAACVILCKRRVNRRFWVPPYLRARGTCSGITLLKDLAMDDIHPLTGEIKCDGSFKISRVLRKPMLLEPEIVLGC